jgi:hypothetical protein
MPGGFDQTMFGETDAQRIRELVSRGLPGVKLCPSHVTAEIKSGIKGSNRRAHGSIDRVACAVTACRDRRRADC